MIFVDTMKRNGKSIKSVDPMLEHMLVSGMFSAFFELLIHKDDIKEAKTYLKQLRAFLYGRLGKGIRDVAGRLIILPSIILVRWLD